MSKREKLLTGAVVVVNISVGIVLASRADFTRLLHPHENAPALALRPADGASTTPDSAPAMRLALTADRPRSSIDGE